MINREKRKSKKFRQCSFCCCTIRINEVYYRYTQIIEEKMMYGRNKEYLHDDCCLDCIDYVDDKMENENDHR